MLGMPQMYFHPSDMLQQFTVLRANPDVDGRGRSVNAWEPVDPPIVVFGYLSENNSQEKEFRNQKQHPGSHRIHIKGEPICKEGDRFLLSVSEAKYEVKYISNPGEFNLWSIYYCEQVK